MSKQIYRNQYRCNGSPAKQVKQEIRSIKIKLNETIEQMTKLRAKLKAKFGEHIGLPEIRNNPKVKR